MPRAIHPENEDGTKDESEAAGADLSRDIEQSAHRVRGGHTGMKPSKYFISTPSGPDSMSILERKSGQELVRFRVLPGAEYMETAEFAGAVSTSLETYAKSVLSRQR